MSSSKSPQTTSQSEDWDSLFSFDPTTSPFFPQPNAGHDPTALGTNLDIFAAQPLFLPEVYLPQPIYYPEQPTSRVQVAQMQPHEHTPSSNAVGDMVHGFDAIRGDLDKVIMAVWQLKNDYQTRIQNLDNEVAQASKAAESLRKDVDAIGGWVEQVVTFLNASNDPSELPCSGEPKPEIGDDMGVADQNQTQ
ncbi:hypothetical protein J4E82_010924 [Alternaria postmessia]|uniref:uncharacterized protein n=1 Tax=Alternaria postmessia TaxID=1187938 RepID=UPI002224EE77|nr:uncharacterized protein J4E82_010924 [Alternaria postmessia]KAI5366977.1 hypothetical protein J4E82_010924 [Alternaria postmessia]